MRKFDKEYSTQYTPEKEYLITIGIKPVYTKVVNEVTTYKYTKTPELFKALEFFYSSKAIDNKTKEIIYGKQMDRRGKEDNS